MYIYLLLEAQQKTFLHTYTMDVKVEYNKDVNAVAKKEREGGRER